MLRLICWWLAVLGGLNWGILGIFSTNLIDNLLGGSLAKIVYIVIGVASAYLIVTGMKKKK